MAVSRSNIVRAVLFDLDGTLLDSDEVHYRAWKIMLSELNIDCTRQYYIEHVSGRANVLIMKDILPHFSTLEQTDFAIRKETMFRNMATELQPMPGLIAFLDHLRHCSIPVACVTNAPRCNAEFMLAALHLTFEILIIGDECEAMKPSPVPYQNAMRILKVNETPQNCWVVEDSFSGITAGLAAGCKVMGITTTHSSASLCAGGCTFATGNFIDLIPLLDIPIQK